MVNLDKLIEETDDMNVNEGILREIRQTTEKLMGMMATHIRNESNF